MKIIIMGKSASGKNFMARKMISLGMKQIVTDTTRAKRPGEKDGIDYHFLSVEQFEKKVRNGKTTIIILSFWCIIIEPILKQFAIARYCRLPLTEEEIKLGVETGDFSSLSTYFAYLNKQMNYGICGCLNFTKSEIKLAINNVVNVFKPRDDEYFELPECICVTLMKHYDKENISCFENLNDGMFLLHNKVAKMTEVPITVSSWGLYGKAYKENADNYFKED